MSERLWTYRRVENLYTLPTKRLKVAFDAIALSGERINAMSIVVILMEQTLQISLIDNDNKAGVIVFR